MKLYIYNYLYNLTDNYHDGGGAVVITDRDPQVVLQEHRLRERSDYYNKRDEEAQVDFEDVTPVVLEVDASEERVFVFPDAGCC